MYRLIAVIALLLIQTQCLAQQAANPTDNSSPAYHHYRLGMALQEKSQYEEALRQYQEAVSLRRDARFYFAIGSAYQALKNYDNALSYYNRAMKMDPKEPFYRDAWENLTAYNLINSAMQKHRSGDLAGAVADYKAALKLKDEKNTHINLAGALSGLHRNDEALEEWQKGGLPAPTYFDHYGDFLRPDGQRLLKPGG